MTFEFYSFALIFLAGVCFYSALQHCTMERLRTKSRLHLLFAGTAFLVAVFSFSLIPSFRVTDIPDYIAIVRINFALSLLIFAALPWFFAEYAGVRPLPLLLGFSALFAVLFLANLVQPYTLLYREIHGLHRLTLPWGEQFSLPVSTTGSWGYLTVLVIYLSQAFCLYLLALHYRRERRFTNLFMLIAQVFFIATTSQGILVRLGLIGTLPPLGPFGFQAMVIAMGMILIYEIKDDRRYLQILLDNVPAQIFMMDSAGRFLSINRHCEETFNFSRAKRQDMTIYDLFPPEQAEMLRRNNQEVFAGHGPLHFEEPITYNGETRTYSTIKVPVCDSSGSPFAVCGIAMDVSDRKRVETELGEYRKHLEELVRQRTSEMEEARNAAETANQARGRFLANMSHEIRTPLNAVLGFAQLLEHDPLLSPQGRDKLRTIMKSGECLLSIINDVLAMARIEAGRIELRAIPVDLNELFHDLDAMFRLRAEEKGLSFASDCAESLPRFISADLGKLRQVLINLLGNAIKFTMYGSITMRAFPAEDDRIAIEIEDSGIGISPEELDSLFEPFVRSSSGADAAGGTGLGLAISREYAHLMDGEITVTSSIAAGSCFRFEFRAPASAPQPHFGSTHPRVIGLAPGQGGLRVLIVDDQSDNRYLLRTMLEPLGFDVDEACGGSEAIEKTRSRLPRIIFMDMVMPGMDGAEATRELRSSFPVGSLTIIGISASAFENQKNYFLESGIDAFIAKPFLKQELFDKLARHAGVRFVTEDLLAVMPAGEALPTLERMSAGWLERFSLALSRGNITLIRQLAEEARESDPALSAYLQNRADLYDLAGLEKLISAGTVVWNTPLIGNDDL
jgi:PAS domain S-box-containing protein